MEEPAPAHGAGAQPGDGATPHQEAQQRVDAPAEGFVGGGAAAGGDAPGVDNCIAPVAAATPGADRVGVQGQRISAAEIQLVQNLVERCLQVRQGGLWDGGLIGGCHTCRAASCVSPSAPLAC